MKKKSLLFLFITFSIFILYLFVLNNEDDNYSKQLTLNNDVTLLLKPYSENSFQFQHRLFSNIDTRPYTEGNGLAGSIKENCNMQASYIGALYKIQYHYKDFKLHSKTIKIGTNTETKWSFVLPFSTNHNSLIYSLTGNNKNMVCTIENLAKVLDGSSGSYKINYANLSFLLLENYNKELLELDEIYNTNTFKQHNKEGFESNIARLKSLDLNVKITKIDKLTTKISVLDKNLKVYEEMTLRITDPFLLENLSEDLITENTEKLSDLF